MAIRNANLGGTDWTFNESPLASSDLNDTFDAVYDILMANPAFYLSSTLSSSYDDFDSYGEGGIPSSTLWSITYAENDPQNYMTSTCSVSSTFSSTVGGSDKAFKFGLVQTGILGNVNYYGRITVSTIALVPNRHTYIKAYGFVSRNGSGSSGDDYLEVSFDNGSTYHNLLYLYTVDDGSTYCSSNVMTIAKGSDNYDCYVGGKMVQNVTSSTFEILFYANRTGASNMQGESYFIIDDARQSLVDI